MTTVESEGLDRWSAITGEVVASQRSGALADRLEDHAVWHSYHHLAGLRAALGRYAR